MTDFCRAALYDIPYTSRYEVEDDVPRYSIPSKGVNARATYQLLHDELMLGEFQPLFLRVKADWEIDGNPNMNLAS